jgi:hypothetical protein
MKNFLAFLLGAGIVAMAQIICSYALPQTNIEETSGIIAVILVSIIISILGSIFQPQIFSRWFIAFMWLGIAGTPVLWFTTVLYLEHDLGMWLGIIATPFLLFSAFIIYTSKKTPT